MVTSSGVAGFVRLRGKCADVYSLGRGGASGFPVIDSVHHQLAGRRASQRPICATPQSLSPSGPGAGSPPGGGPPAGGCARCPSGASCPSLLGKRRYIQLKVAAGVLASIAWHPVLSGPDRGSAVLGHKQRAATGLVAVAAAYPGRRQLATDTKNDHGAAERRN